MVGEYQKFMTLVVKLFSLFSDWNFKNSNAVFVCRTLFLFSDTKYINKNPLII